MPRLDRARLRNEAHAIVDLVHLATEHWMQLECADPMRTFTLRNMRDALAVAERLVEEAGDAP